MTQRQLEILERLAEVGIGVAESLAKRAKTAGPEELNALAADYVRVARAVRQTILLHARLANGAPWTVETPAPAVVEQSGEVRQIAGPRKVH